LEVDPVTGEVRGAATLEARASARLKSFTLDFQGFEIEASTVNGQSAGHSQAWSELRIEPAQVLRQASRFTTRVL
jgi:hypothetical protein